MDITSTVATIIYKINMPYPEKLKEYGKKENV
jgi:hypothetical protein